MDCRSFDNWTRTRASTANRRILIGWSISAGIAGALARVFPSSAQFDGSSGSCTYDIELTSSVTIGATATGTLVIDLADGGAIETGSLTLQGQPPASVVGQSNGPAIDLLASLADGSTLSLTGLAIGPITECPETVSGHLANAGTGQLGTWIANTNGASAPTPTPTPGSQSGSTSGGSSGGGQATTCPPTQCGDAFVLDQQSCECVCAGGTVPCGPNCCPSGSSCADPGQGICGCPGGTTQCGTACVPDCSGDEFLDLDTCQCEGPQEPVCIENNQSCQNHGQCCSGYCGGGTCFSCSGIVCGDFGCVDPSIDSQHCGNCFSPCIGTTCINGSCQ